MPVGCTGTPGELLRRRSRIGMTSRGIIAQLSPPSSVALEVVFRRGGEEVARSRQPVMIEPGKFGYQLVRGEIDFEATGTVEAHCRLEGRSDEAIIVPLTVLPPVQVGE